MIEFNGYVFKKIKFRGSKTSIYGSNLVTIKDYNDKNFYFYEILEKLFLKVSKFFKTQKNFLVMTKSFHYLCENKM